MTFVHGKDTRVLLDGFDLSRWMRQANMDFSVEMADTAAFLSADRTSIPGHRGATYDLSGMMFADPSPGTAPETADLLALVEANPQPHSVLAIGYGGFAVGQPVWGGFGRMSTWAPSTPFNDVVGFSPRFVSDDKLALGRSLHDYATGATAGGNSAAVDNAAASTFGLIGTLNVVANTRNGATVVKIQHSADNSTWADLVTFASVAGGALTTVGQRVEVAGSVNRYLRALWTIAGSSGSVSFTVVAYRLVSLAA